MAVDAPTPLGAEDTARLTDFARACKAAARAVVLYPAGLWPPDRTDTGRPAPTA